MRAYFAVIKDSFREAFASKVLWVLLALITLLLALLLPLGMVEGVATTFQRRDISDRSGLLTRLSEEGPQDESSPAGQVWKNFSTDYQQLARKIGEETNEQVTEDEWRRMRFRIVDEINRSLKDQEFYDQASWNGVVLNDEARELVKLPTDSLTKDQLARRNRLLIEAAFPREITASSSNEVFVAYLGFTISENLRLAADDVKPIVQQILAAFIMIFVGILGVFVAILVTSSIIPRMFEAGAIDLLLSKPVSRSLLFLSKFIGGCSFILLNAAYLIVGLWLIAGLRFDLWSNRLLLCIPVFLFLFAIYFSVSAFSGVVWRGAVMSVVMTIVFWGACFTVGTAKTTIELLLLNPTRLAAVVPSGDTLIVKNRSGATFQWGEAEHKWEEVFAADDSQTRQGPPFALMSSIIGPVYDPVHDRIVAATAGNRRFGGGNAGNILVGSRDDDWQRRNGVAVPNGVQSLFVTDQGTILVTGREGIWEFQGDPSVEQQPFVISGFDIGRIFSKSEVGKFDDVASNDLPRWNSPFAAAFDPATERIVVYSRGKLSLLSRNDDREFVEANNRDMNRDEPGVLGFAGDHLTVALRNGEIQIVSTDTLETQSTFEPFGKIAPRQVVSSADGRLVAVLFHNGKLWLYNIDSQEEIRSGVVRQNDITTVHFLPENRLLLGDRFTRLTEYDLDSFEMVRQYQQESDWLEFSFHYFIEPIYTIFPKPGELDSLVQYLLTDESSESVIGNDNDLEGQRVVYDIWQPVWSNLAFLSVMLLVTCIYISRKDF